MQDDPDISIFDITGACNSARYNCFQRGFKFSREKLGSNYIGTYYSLDDFINEALLDPLYTAFLEACTVDNSEPGFISFHVDLSALPRAGKFIYTTDAELIHIFHLRKGDHQQ